MVIIYMKKEYKISRYIILVLTFVIFNIMFINEDKSWLILPFVFALITFGFSFPSTIFSKKIIKLGDNIKNKALKILFYMFLPIVLLLLSVEVATIIALIFQNFLPNKSLGQGLLVLFLLSIIMIAIILPYNQTIIVLITRRIKKDTK